MFPFRQRPCLVGEPVPRRVGQGVAEEVGLLAAGRQGREIHPRLMTHPKHGVERRQGRAAGGFVLDLECDRPGDLVEQPGDDLEVLQRLGRRTFQPQRRSEGPRPVAELIETDPTLEQLLHQLVGGELSRLSQRLGGGDQPPFQLVEPGPERREVGPELHPCGLLGHVDGDGPARALPLLAERLGGLPGAHGVGVALAQQFPAEGQAALQDRLGGVEVAPVPEEQREAVQAGDVVEVALAQDPASDFEGAPDVRLGPVEVVAQEP